MQAIPGLELPWEIAWRESNGMVFERDSIPAISHILVFEWRTGFLSTIHKEYNQKASFFIEVMTSILEIWIYQ
jgi:hypothetical protein